MASASFVCRACLAGNLRMLQINNKHLKLFEKLTNIEVNSESDAGMPSTVCYVCHQLLQRCLLFSDMARHSDKTMRDMLHNGVEITCSTITMLSLATPTLSMAPTQYLSATDYCTEATIEEEQLDVKIETEEAFYEELPIATQENDEVVDSSKRHLSVIDHSNITSTVATVEEDQLDVKIEETQGTIYEELPIATEENDEVVDRSTEHLSVIDYSNITSTVATVEEDQLDVKIEETQGTIYEELPMATEENDEDVDRSTEHLSVIDYSNVTSTVATVKEEQLDAKIEETQGTIYKDLLMATEENDEDVDSSNKLKVKTISEEETKQTDTILFMYCDNCNKKFFSKHHLVKHLKSHTRKKPFSCSRCDKAFNQKSYLISHMRVHTGEKPYSCSRCGKEFNQKGNLISHMRVHTGEKPYSCSRCGKEFNQKGNLISHMRVHTGEKPYSCSRCDKEFNQKGNMISHMRVHTGEKPYSCSTCAKAFNQKNYLIKHMRVHTEEEPYSCSRCDKAFSKKSHLISHMRVHTGEKPYSCSRCGKEFNQKGNLISHMRVHTGEKPYSCSRCGKEFNQKGNLISHMRVHTGEKPHSCSRCDKAFKQRSALISHTRVHTEEKPYSCSRCDKAFKQRSALISHTRVHTGEKPYSCSRCDKAFSLKSTLTAHMRLHTGEKPYSCSRCDKAFSQRSSLRFHMRVHTGENLY